MWLEFSSALGPYRVFSSRDIRKIFPNMNMMNLVRWQEKGYIIRIRNGWYCFADTESSENIDWLAANLICQPSYISLQTALSWYNLIPEAIYNTTSVTTKKTNRFTTPLGSFIYHRIKPELFGFGQTLMEVDASVNRPGRGRKIALASFEKAILDFLYTNSFYRTEKELEGLRLNETVLKEALNGKFFTYLEKYGSRALEERVFKLIKVYS